jgi:hypothetical protein
LFLETQMSNTECHRWQEFVELEYHIPINCKNNFSLLVFIPVFSCYQNVRSNVCLNNSLFSFTCLSCNIDDSSFERVGEFKYLGTTPTNQNSIQEEIKGKLKSGNACYHSVQNFLCSWLLSKNPKIYTDYNFTCCFVWV